MIEGVPYERSLYPGSESPSAQRSGINNYTGVLRHRSTHYQVWVLETKSYARAHTNLPRNLNCNEVPVQRERYERDLNGKNSSGMW